ncbi:TetR family transcriptional regulator [Mycolicibacterium sp. HS_4_1]
MALAARHKRGRPLTPRAAPSRELIVHSARTVFNDVGYSATTLQEIAARIDVARTLVSRATKHAVRLSFPSHAPVAIHGPATVAYSDTYVGERFRAASPTPPEPRNAVAMGGNK